MGGMFIGSWLLWRVVPLNRSPLKVYAVLELGIAASGLCIPIAAPYLSRIYFDYLGYGPLNLLVRAAIGAVVLTLPTTLMGATLPAVARSIRATKEGMADIGALYSANSFGAVVGTVGAGFYLLKEFDFYTASYVAVALNLAVALLALGVAGVFADDRITTKSESETAAPVENIWPVYFAISLSGFASLGAQIVWTRQLSLLFGATVYTFSVILGVFLVGLGVGSAAGTVIGQRAQNPRTTLGVVQLLLVVCIAYGAYSIQSILPNLRMLDSTSNWVSIYIDHSLRCAIAIFPATFWWGASFPLALAGLQPAKKRAVDLGKWSGRIYAANTLGAIVGALLVSLVLIPYVGTASSQVILAFSSAIAAAVIFSNYGLELNPQEISGKGREERRSPIAVTLAILVFALFASRLIPRLNPNLIAYGYVTELWKPVEWFLQVEEGITSSVAISHSEQVSEREFHVSGKTEASSLPPDMRLQRMLGHFPALFHGAPKSVLVIGFGAGVTAGSFALHPSVKRIVVVEIEPRVVDAAGAHFREENYDLINDPRVQFIFDDARHYIATTREKFDIISTDPIHPWVRGSAALYTKEFLELCRSRLNPNGFVSQWVPLYETDEQAVKSEIRTFFEVFPEGVAWSSDQRRKGYDLAVIGSLEPLRISSRAIAAEFRDNPRLMTSLSTVGFDSAVKILQSYSGGKLELADWLQDGELNLDRNLRLEYLAGKAFTFDSSNLIYQAMISRVKYPENVFDVSSDESRELREFFSNR